MKRSTDKSPALAHTVDRSRPRSDTQVPAAPRAPMVASAPPRPVPAQPGVGPNRRARRGPLANSHHGPGQHLRGLTLIELLVALSIATLVLTLGVTGMTQLVAQNRRVAEVNTLMGNLNFARAEAVFRMANVTVCPIDPANLPDAPDDPCATIAEGDGDIQWQQGYIVYVSTTGERLRVQDRTGSVRIETPATRSRVTFASDGSVAGNNLTLRVCDQRDQSSTDSGREPGIVPPRAVVVSPIGRVRVSDRSTAGSIDCSTGSAADSDDTDD